MADSNPCFSLERAIAPPSPAPTYGSAATARCLFAIRDPAATRPSRLPREIPRPSECQRCPASKPDALVDVAQEEVEGRVAAIDRERRIELAACFHVQAFLEE